jgi:hypothetical protein
MVKAGILSDKHFSVFAPALLCAYRSKSGSAGQSLNGCKWQYLFCTIFIDLYIFV